MSESKKMTIHLRVWRQSGPNAPGVLEDHTLDDVSSDMSFLEMLDVLNEKLIAKGEEPYAFDHDCREGICGCCSLTIDGVPHGPEKGTTVCQLHMRSYHDGDTVVVEPFRARAFPVIKDLHVDRSAFDRVIQSGGYNSVNVGSAQDANALLIGRDLAEKAFDAAACIGCGACVAACKNASAMLFVGAKVSQLALMPQGQPERKSRVKKMVEQMDQEGFGNCSNTGACSAVCPKEISLDVIRRMNVELVRAAICND